MNNSNNTQDNVPKEGIEDDNFWKKQRLMLKLESRIAELEKKNSELIDILTSILPMAKDGLIELNKVFNSQYNWKEEKAIKSAEQVLKPKQQ